ncbi:hypothetical protein Q1695_003326 [Nippostrongylus brasiliensis]|nr:hypothetical protein Q1695_003326 [Nippostrongylus brasiliensis]
MLEQKESKVDQGPKKVSNSEDPVEIFTAIEKKETDEDTDTLAGVESIANVEGVDSKENEQVKPSLKCANSDESQNVPTAKETEYSKQPN